MTRRHKIDPFIPHLNTIPHESIAADILEALDEGLWRLPARIEIAMEQVIEEHGGAPLLKLHLHTTATRSAVYAYPRTGDGGWSIGAQGSLRPAIEMLRQAAARGAGRSLFGLGGSGGGAAGSEAGEESEP